MIRRIYVRVRRPVQPIAQMHVTFVALTNGLHVLIQPDLLCVLAQRHPVQ